MAKSAGKPAGPNLNAPPPPQGSAPKPPAPPAPPTSQPGAGTQPAMPPVDNEKARREGTQRKADQAAAGLPPADLVTLMEFLAQQITLYLGEPDPSGRAMQPNLPLAGLFIDLLGVLQEKTKGNLNLEEGQVLDQLLYALRLRYVQQRR